MYENPTVVAVLSAGRPENLAFILSALFIAATVYLIRYSPASSDKVQNVIISGLGAALPIGVWFAIQSLTERANDNVPDVSMPRLNENAWLITLVLVAIAIATLVFCLTEKYLPNTLRNRVAATSGGILLVLVSVSLAAGCTVLYLTNNASALKVWALIVWQYSTLIAAVVGLVFVISAPLAIRAHLRYNRDLAAQATKNIEKMLAGRNNDEQEGPNQA